MIGFINIHELHSRTPQAILAVERGKKLIITKRGRPKALLLPLSEDEIEDLVLKSKPFLKELEKAELSARRKGWRTLEDVKKELGL